MTISSRDLLRYLPGMAFPVDILAAKDNRVLFQATREQLRAMIAAGAYQKRRQKRRDRDYRNWHNVGNGEFWLVEGRELWCHPDDFEKLKAALQ
jgi:hypothetical protein